PRRTGRAGRAAATAGTWRLSGWWPWLALSVPTDKVEVGLVEFGRVLPDAAMTALGRGPLRARDALVDPPRQRDRDEDVLLPGHHEGRRGDLAEAADGVVALDHRELGEIGVDRLVHVPHRGLEFLELGFALLEERHREGPERDVAHDERDPEHRGHVTPHREHTGAERPGRRVGAGDGDRTQVTGISEGVFLGDHPAHGDAHQMETGNRSEE